MKSPEEFPRYVENEGGWEFYRPVLCQFITTEEVPEDAYGAEQVQDVFPHGDTYMPDTGMKAKYDAFPDPVWDSRSEFEAYVRDLAEYKLLELEELEFDDPNIEDEITGIRRAGELDGRDIHMLVSQIDERVKALQEEASP